MPGSARFRFIEELGVGDSRLARVEDDELSSVTLESFEEGEKVVGSQVELGDHEGLVHRDVVDGIVASVEDLDQSPGRLVLAAVEVAHAEALDLLVARKLWVALLAVELEQGLVQDFAGVLSEGTREVLVRHVRRVLLVVKREDGVHEDRTGVHVADLGLEVVKDLEIVVVLLGVQLNDLAEVEVGEDDLALGLSELGVDRGLALQEDAHDRVEVVHHVLAPSHRRVPSVSLELAGEGRGDHLQEDVPLLGQAHLGHVRVGAAEGGQDLHVNDLIQGLDDAGFAIGEDRALKKTRLGADAGVDGRQLDSQLLHLRQVFVSHEYTVNLLEGFHLHDEVDVHMRMAPRQLLAPQDLIIENDLSTSL